MREVATPTATGDEEMLSVSHLTGVTPRSEKTVYMFEAESTVGYKLVAKGDLVINTMWAWMGAAGTAPVGGIVSPAYGVYRIDNSIADPRWVDYVIRTPRYVTEMTRHSRGVTSSRLRLYPDEFLRLSMSVPTLAEQRAIADYLDAETARIDALVSKKQQLIHLLEERWVALRNQSVLRGVDPLSGYGTLPEGWSCPQLGVLIELQRGHDLPAEARREGPVPVISSGGISGHHDEWACRAPAVVTGRYGTVGEVYFVEEDCWPLNTTLYVKDFRGNDPRWVAFILESLPLDAESEKSAVGGINRNVIGKLRVPRPAVDEQVRIASQLARARARQVACRRVLESQLELLAEHRQALITASVTCKVNAPSVRVSGAP